MRKVTILALVLSFATPQLALANGGDSLLQGSINSTAPARADQIRDLQRRLALAKRELTALQGELATAEHAYDGADLRARVFNVTFGLSAMTAIMGLIAAGSRQAHIVRRGGSMVAISGIGAMLSLILLRGQQQQLRLTGAQVLELNNELIHAQAEITVIQIDLADLDASAQ